MWHFKEPCHFWLRPCRDTCQIVSQLLIEIESSQRRQNVGKMHIYISGMSILIKAPEVYFLRKFEKKLLKILIFAPAKSYLSFWLSYRAITHTKMYERISTLQLVVEFRFVSITRIKILDFTLTLIMASSRYEFDFCGVWWSNHYH